MTYPLHRQQLRGQVDSYLKDSAKMAKASIAAAHSAKAFQGIYSVSLSADVVLEGLDAEHLRPRLGAARSIILRIPMLVSLGQPSLAEVEMRRLVELVLWTVYFTDHPIEWGSFQQGSSAGFSQDAKKPISYAAHRAAVYYFEYANELMRSEPSGIAGRAVNAMKQVTRQLNTSVHAGELAQSLAKTPPHEKLSEDVLRKVGRIQKQVFSNCCLLMAAYRRQEFDRLGAAARAHFDWLVGLGLRRSVRKGPFGLQRVATVSDGPPVGFSTDRSAGRVQNCSKS